MNLVFKPIGKTKNVKVPGYNAIIEISQWGYTEYNSMKNRATIVTGNSKIIDTVKHDELQYDLVKKHIHGWNLKDEEKKDVVFNPENLELFLQAAGNTMVDSGTFNNAGKEMQCCLIDWFAFRMKDPQTFVENDIENLENTSSQKLTSVKTGGTPTGTENTTEN